MKVGFRRYLFVNGKEIIAKHGTSISWIPESCLPDGVIREIESKEIIRHYGLDETRAWSFHRLACPWATKRKPESKSVNRNEKINLYSRKRDWLDKCMSKIF